MEMRGIDFNSGRRWKMKRKSAEEFVEKCRTDKEFEKRIFVPGESVEKRMVRAREAGFDFSAEEIHKLVVPPKMLQRMEQAKNRGETLTFDEVKKLRAEEKIDVLSDEELDRVVGGGDSKCGACHI